MNAPAKFFLSLAFAFAVVAGILIFVSWPVAQAGEWRNAAICLWVAIGCFVFAFLFVAAAFCSDDDENKGGNG